MSEGPRALAFEPVAPEAWAAPDCAGPRSKGFSRHGIHLAQRADGLLLLVMLERMLAARRLWLMTLCVLWVSSGVSAQQSEPCNCDTPRVAAKQTPEQAERKLAPQRSSEARPSVAGPVLLTAGGIAAGVVALAIGVEQRPLCTDGCRPDIPTPYLVTAALAGGAVIAGTVWLIAVLSAGSPASTASEAKMAARPRCSFELQLTPAVANASLRVAF